jgi:cell division transport system ATP-binding protein
MIQAYHVTKLYQRGDRPALRDVNLQVEKGAFAFLTGPSGAGKSTLLRLLFAAERPTSGQILVHGRNLSTLNTRQIAHLRREVSVVFQDFKLIQNRTVYENIAYALHVMGLPEREIKRRIYRVLKRVGLFHKAGVLPTRLSGGEQQRVALARALVNDPVLLLADEPTGNLDDDLTREIMSLLQDANARGTTVLIATHDAAILDHYGERIIHLQAGLLQDQTHTARASNPTARAS